MTRKCPIIRTISQKIKFVEMLKIYDEIWQHSGLDLIKQMFYTDTTDKTGKVVGKDELWREELPVTKISAMW